ncbi:transposase, partial [Roseovarius sp. MBR-38]
ASRQRVTGGRIARNRWAHVVGMGGRMFRNTQKWALRDKMPIREIARRTGVSRNTIKKYLREGIVEPAFQAPDRPSKLDPYAEKLSSWLVSEQRKSRKERRTAKQMHADLVQLGFDGSYERVAAFVREWKGERLGNLPLFNGVHP